MQGRSLDSQSSTRSRYPGTLDAALTESLIRGAGTHRRSNQVHLPAVTRQRTSRLSWDLARDLARVPMKSISQVARRKRNETLQLAIIRPRIAILDELDSGLDVDALGQVSRRIERATREGDPPWA